jgi:hypothetical protein
MEAENLRAVQSGKALNTALAQEVCPHKVALRLAFVARWYFLLATLWAIVASGSAAEIVKLSLPPRQVMTRAEVCGIKARPCSYVVLVLRPGGDRTVSDLRAQKPPAGGA